MGFNYGNYAEMSEHYNPDKLSHGYNRLDGEELFFVSNPGLGLWAHKSRLFELKRHCEVHVACRECELKPDFSASRGEVAPLSVRRFEAPESHDSRDLSAPGPVEPASRIRMA